MAEKKAPVSDGLSEWVTVCASVWRIEWVMDKLMEKLLF